MVNVERLVKELEEAFRELEERGICRRGEPRCVDLVAAALYREAASDAVSAAETLMNAIEGLNKAIRELEEKLRYIG